MAPLGRRRADHAWEALLVDDNAPDGAKEKVRTPMSLTSTREEAILSFAAPIVTVTKQVNTKPDDVR